MSRGTVIRCFAIVTSALLLAVGSTPAQEVTGTLYGKVIDESGLPVPGATITITSPQLIKGAEVRVTTERGTYRVPSLPPGTYTVKAEMQGFQTVSYPDVVLKAGSSIGVDFALKLTPLEETVTVTGESPLVDVKSAQTMRTVSNEVVENIPIGRRFSDLITTAAGVLDSEYDFAPAQTVHGGSVRDNLYNVDGAGANDTTVGYMSMDIPYDIMEEVQITTGGISAEFGQTSGAVFNFITKSGGNAFHGGVNLYLEDDALQWDNLTDELIAQGIQQGTKVTKNLRYGFTFGGPVLRDRVWFFGNLRWFDREMTRPDFPALNPTVTERHGFVKITSQIAAKTKVHGSFTNVDREEYPSNANFSTNGAPETWERGLRDQNIVQFSLTQVLATSTFFEAQFSQALVDLDSEHANNESGYFDIVTGLNSGGWTGTSGKTFTRDKRTLKANLSHFRDDWGGTHNFKLGYYRWPADNDLRSRSELSGNTAGEHPDQSQRPRAAEARLLWARGRFPPQAARRLPVLRLDQHRTLRGQHRQLFRAVVGPGQCLQQSEHVDQRRWAARSRRPLRSQADGNLPGALRDPPERVLHRHLRLPDQAGGNVPGRHPRHLHRALHPGGQPAHHRGVEHRRRRRPAGNPPLRLPQQALLPGGETGGSRKANVGLLADIFNVLNISSVNTVQIQRFGHPNFLKPALIETPRSVRVAVRVNF